MKNNLADYKMDYNWITAGLQQGAYPWEAPSSVLEIFDQGKSELQWKTINTKWITAVKHFIVLAQERFY